MTSCSEQKSSPKSVTFITVTQGCLVILSLRMDSYTLMQKEQHFQCFSYEK